MLKISTTLRLICWRNEHVFRCGLCAVYIAEFPKSVMRLVRNKPYVVNVGCTVCYSYTIMGVLANLVRYVEIHFGERAFVGSIIAGARSFVVYILNKLISNAIFAHSTI